MSNHIHTLIKDKTDRQIIRAREGVSEASDSRIVTTGENNRLPLTSILADDPAALAWAKAVRSRFPNAKPLWGVSSVGNVGEDPQIGAVPWRLWWEGLV